MEHYSPVHCLPLFSFLPHLLNVAGNQALANPVLRISSFSSPTFLAFWLVERESSFERATHGRLSCASLRWRRPRLVDAAPIRTWIYPHFPRLLFSSSDWSSKIHLVRAAQTMLGFVLFVKCSSVYKHTFTYHVVKRAVLQDSTRPFRV